ncbi:hypothetical protein GCM10010840_36780 [Deinococcus aerolatus]|uniref:Uncharacterized protein n=1 Tax=Deinococcus aerolatus TaxID=522487 RepID=A0ABQ2GHF7_9DEIO|nr:glycosyltransferase [Deinococcus aerolatus]GGL95344.1 hypothetical protein GCM10010840_36780 [Deinococcus aerolatus]
MPHPAHPRILHVITHLDMGGAENVAISLAEELHAEFNFSFFAVGGVADNPVGQEMVRRLERLEMPVHSGTTLGFRRGGLVQAGIRLNRLIWKIRPEIVHLHTEIPETTFAVASLLGLPTATRIVRTVHNSEIWPAWQRIGRLVEHHLRHVEVVGVSKACLDGLREFQSAQHLPLIPEDQACVVYNGVLSQGSDLLRQDSRPAGRPTRVLFAGRLELQKGVDLLPNVLTAAAALTARPVEVTILGHGSLENLLRQWIQTHSLPWTVTLAEPVANLAEHMGNYDVMLVPSRFEGLCLVAIEALMAGIPVVATSVRGLNEIFPPGYPLLCDLEDVSCLARVLAGTIENLDHYVGVVAQERAGVVERFNLDGMARGYRHRYRSLLQPARYEG